MPAWLNSTSESIVTTINVGSDKFEKFKSIQWLDITNRPKKKILKQFQKQRNFQVHFYEYGITFVTKNGNETMPIRTSPFPILDLYWLDNLCEEKSKIYKKNSEIFMIAIVFLSNLVPFGDYRIVWRQYLKFRFWTSSIWWCYVSLKFSQIW